MADVPLNAESAPLDERQFGSYWKILVLAGPLILSHMGVMLMQVVDGLFLARYSKDAIAAIGPAGMTFWLLCGLFIGLVGYTNTFVAQYVGAKRPERVGAAVWQGIYLSLLSGAVLLAASLGASAIFALSGHEPGIQVNEVTYFRILCYGGPAFMLSAAISGFFAGRHDNHVLLVGHVLGGVTNAVLDYALIFGKWGFPEMGMAGAAWATVAGQGVQVLFMGTLLFRGAFRREFGTWRNRAIDGELLWRMCVYGFPNGVRYVMEISAWTVFLWLMGRVSSDGLAASNVVWRINGMAFFPVIGMSIAISMLVGQAQGAGRPDLSRRVTVRGMALAEGWMFLCAAMMLLMPGPLLSLFFEGGQDPAGLRPLCVQLLWFVAVYCMVDGLNIVLMSVLAGAGDTRWMLIVSGSLHLAFMGLLVALVFLWNAGIYLMWTAATAFICSFVIALLFRFRSGQWEDKRVIEHQPPDIETMPVPGG